ncbi:MAG: Lrp/AsnC family transcriptional regulator [Deltaproteobacteria bacterium]|nr:Lrp/AsnC family transcriptional regulator [Deltaproteobacteria bacterium]
MKELNSLDIKILRELDRDSKATYSDIAKLVKATHDTVRYRIQKLVKDQVIFKFQTGLDWTKLGYQVYQMLLRVPAANEATLNSISDFLVGRDEVVWVAKSDGPFEIAIAVHTTSISDFSMFVDNLLGEFSNVISERVLMLNTFHEYLPRDFLTDSKRQPKKTKFFSTHPENVYELEEEDRAILLILGENSRYSASDIEKILKKRSKINLNQAQISYRIKKLLNDEIIVGSPLAIRHSKMGLLQYKVLFRFGRSDSADWEKLLQECRKLPQCVFLVKQLGAWDYEIDLEVRDAGEIRAILSKLFSKYPGVVREHLTLPIREVVKFGAHTPLNL